MSDDEFRKRVEFIRQRRQLSLPQAIIEACEHFFREERKARQRMAKEIRRGISESDPE